MNGLSSPTSKRGRLQRACLERLRDHEAKDGLPTNGRFIFYELVQLGAVPKNDKSRKRGRQPMQDVCDALLWLREAEIVPWSWILDETREFIAWHAAPTIADYLLDTIERARLDLWPDRAPLIITESRSLAGVLHNLAGRYLAPLASTNGQCKGFLVNEVAPMLSTGDRVLYLGDYDWQGGQIEANTRRVLEQIVGPLDWTRLAITAEQVEHYSLPVIKKADHRYKPVRHHPAVETEALGQAVIVGIVRDALDDLLPEPIKDVLEREEHQREPLVRLLGEVRP